MADVEKGLERERADETELAGLVRAKTPSPERSVDASVVGRSTDNGKFGQAVNVAVANVTKNDEKKCFGVPLSWVALLTLTVIGTAAPLQTAWTRRMNIEGGGPRYLNSSIILFGECVKVVTSFMLLCREEGSIAKAVNGVRIAVTENIMDTVKIAVPALLYAVQGNLLFFAMDRLSPPVYTVSYQLKILTTALLSVIMLGKKLGPVKWLALVFLTAGVSLVQLQGSGDTPSGDETNFVTTTMPPTQADGMGNAAAGLIAVLMACCTSGLAGVYLEKMLTQTSASIWMRNVQLGSVGAIMAIGTAVAKDSAKLMEGGFLQGFGERECALFVMHACGGLASAAVLKYAGNILKCFAAAISVVLVSIISMFLTGFLPDLFFNSGVALVIASVFLYNVGLPAAVEKWFTDLCAASSDAIKAGDISNVMDMVPASTFAGGSHTK